MGIPKVANWPNNEEFTPLFYIAKYGVKIADVLGTGQELSENLQSDFDVTERSASIDINRIINAKYGRLYERNIPKIYTNRPNLIKLSYSKYSSFVGIQRSTPLQTSSS